MATAPGKTILIVDDDDAFGSILDGYLQSVSFKTLRAGTGRELFALLAARQIDAIILDLTLPDEDGLAITRRVRARSRVPIIIVTGRKNVDDRLAGLELGADDFMTKPFNPRELVIRVRRLLDDRPRPPSIQAERYRFSGWVIDPGRRTVEGQGTAAELTRMEFDALLALVRARGRVLSRAQLVDTTTRGEGPESERSVDILISRLRRKLDPSRSTPTLLITVPGHGYRINDTLLQTLPETHGYESDTI